MASHASAALAGEAERALVASAEEQARAEDHAFQQVSGYAQSLASYATWLYDHPDYFPPFLKGGTPLVSTAEGHLVNDPDTPVGVFVPKSANPTVATWTEVGLLSFADPLLAGSHEAVDDSLRSWVISATGIVRIYPNLKLGYPGSPVGPAHDLRLNEQFLAAAPERNPDKTPQWTRPYLDPAGQGLMITAAVPVYDSRGTFRAVAGIDIALDHVVNEILGARAGPGGYAMLIDDQGNVVCAQEAALGDLGLTAVDPHPGQALDLALTASPLAGVRDLASRLAAATGPGLAEFGAASGERTAGFAPLATTGWILVRSLPRSQLATPASLLDAEISRLRRNLMAASVLVVGLVALAIALGAVRVGRSLARPLGLLAAGARRLGRDLSYRVPDLGTDEIGSLGREVNAMAERLQESQAEAVRLTEEAAAERQGRLLAVADERSRIAREIHDTIAQGLAGAVLQLDNIRELALDGDNAGAAEGAGRAAQLARESLADARRSVWRLHPQPIEGRSLGDALRALATNNPWQPAFTVVVRIQQGVEGVILDPDQEEALYRVAHEALHNSARHSGAAQATVTFGRAPDGGAGTSAVVLEVSDSGRGFDPGAVTPGAGGGFGIWAMRERLAAAGGSLTVLSAPGKGTAVRATVSPRGAGAPEPGAGAAGQEGVMER